MPPSPPSAPANSSPRPSLDSFDSGIHEFDSSSALILVPEHNEHDDIDGEDPAAFDFINSSDEDELPNGESQDNLSERATSGPYSSVPALSSLSVFLYLLSPLLKLGALLSPSVGERGLKIALPTLLFFASLCALTRQIWYMLARYVRRADMEEIILQAFARKAGRGREGERKRRWIRRLVLLSTGTLRVLLIALYLRSSTDAITPLFPHRILAPVPLRVIVTLVLAAIVLPLSVPPTASLGSTSVVWASWMSVAAFTAWVAGTAYAHARGISQTPSKDSEAEGSIGILWQGLSKYTIDPAQSLSLILAGAVGIISFTFATSSTLPLYSALRASSDGFGGPKPRRSRSFKLYSFGSIVLAIALILPPVVFSSVAAAPFRTEISQDPSPEARTPIAFKCFMGFFSSTTLALGIPSVLVTAPTFSLPLSMRRYVNHLLVSRVILFAVSLGIALLPAALVRLASDILMVLAFLGTFTIPALLHIVIHNFRRPLSIVMPPTTPRPGSSPSFHQSDSHTDELLQRKERTLQRRRFTRRVLWDIGVWVLLLPVGGGGLVWAAGRAARQW
ncbi:hypothetical protein BDY19DRAFT_958221 [Irpex rosettiformis]|uniref:Uncharacterized protein n=1 Tax=Irpex rosettiformis TaxID=378272 RepID=A0ACB8TY89_9APHY|nr:hypothetical protein BDY19DRAFT_958221 [Irpex rosettiformis]